MGEPTVSFRPMPVFYIRRDNDHGARTEINGSFPFFLIPPFTGCAEEDLSAVFSGVMDVPVVAASGFKRHIGKEQRAGLRIRQRIQIRIPDKVLCICSVEFSQPKNIFLIKLFFIH